MPGDVVVYTMQYGNRSSLPASGVWLTETLPAELAFVAADPAPLSTTLPLRWDLGDLEPQSGPFTIVLTATVLPSTTIPSTLEVVARIESSATEVEVANNQSVSATWVGYRIYLPLVMNAFAR